VLCDSQRKVQLLISKKYSQKSLFQREFCKLLGTNIKDGAFDNVKLSYPIRKNQLHDHSCEKLNKALDLHVMNLRRWSDQIFGVKILIKISGFGARWACGDLEIWLSPSLAYRHVVKNYYQRGILAKVNSGVNKRVEGEGSLRGDYHGLDEGQDEGEGVEGGGAAPLKDDYV